MVIPTPFPSVYPLVTHSIDQPHSNPHQQTAIADGAARHPVHPDSPK